jgi:histidinol dehydrogenase
LILQAKVQRLLNDIRKRGDAAVAASLRRFDGVALPATRWRVPAAQVRAALASLPAAEKSVLTRAARRIEGFHREERRRAGASWSKKTGGVTVGQQVTPVDSAGLYVPGGRFAYPSTVLMTAIPARCAGVKRVAMTTPPRHLTREVLAAAALAGVDEVYQIGGVAAVGALALGTATVPKVDLIVGPGGAWVTEAKRQVFGDVGIDLLAGPSEIVLLADGSAPARFAAADMMAQAEHDPLARATVISTEKRVLDEVRAAVEARFRGQCRFLKAASWNAAVDKANELAGEHVALMVRRPRALLGRLRHGGAVFLGPWSPVAAGDYWAGPSHVLPTGRSARFSSGLSVQTFLKRSSRIEVSRAAIRREARSIARLARAEGLVFHAKSLVERTR